MLLRAEPTFSDGLDDNSVWIRLVFSGCRKAAKGSPCKNCHNPELWDFNAMKDIYGSASTRIQSLRNLLSGWKSDDIKFDGISVIGGEPLDQDFEEAQSVLSIVKMFYPGIPLITYSGYAEEQFFRSPDCINHPFVKAADYIKLGPFVEELKTPEDCKARPMLGSMNQALYRRVIKEDGCVTYEKVNMQF